METSAALEQLIAAHPFLSGLAPEFQSFLWDCASLRRFGSHQQIFQEAGEADHFYLIVSGKVTLDATVPDCGTLPIQTLEAGEALGWSWLFPPYQWAFTATTAVPTDVLSFGARLLRQKASEDPAFANELLSRIAKTLIQRLLATRNELIHLYRVMSEHRITA